MDSSLISIDLERYVFLKKRKEIFYALVSVAKSDGEVSEKEYQFLYNYSAVFGLDRESVNTLLEADVFPPLRIDTLLPIQKEMLLVDFILMAFADDLIAEDEYRKLSVLCSQHNIPISMLDRYIAYFKHNPKKVQQAYRSIAGLRSKNKAETIL